MAMINLTPSGGDDQPQIQAAVNSLLASGGAVRLAAGNWVLKSTLVIGSDAAPSSVALIYDPET